MLTISLLAYLADVWILLTYLLRRHRAFDWANAVGAIPLCAIEILAAAWAPLVLTAAFGVIAAIHLIHPAEKLS